ncbi:hypothetical protein [Microbulbifer halophilus]|uniref:Uncharacterized protein n=1 Tax=Microbulbifer halophilus TaxID=453963 RepID=A0ABW5EGX5_9GAMM|nr:hypothetical protein [Microbulbifer halophilus]MCW8125740.1 hypothetical protein [Microbulbifer halophilus]
MSVNNDASNRLCSGVETNVHNEQKPARGKAELRRRLEHLLRQIARALDLEGRSQFK